MEQIAILFVVLFVVLFAVGVFAGQGMSQVSRDRRQA